MELLHQRQYQTRVHLLVRGVIVDDKPPGLFIESDPDWLEVHRMEVESANDHARRVARCPVRLATMMPVF